MALFNDFAGAVPECRDCPVWLPD